MTSYHDYADFVAKAAESPGDGTVRLVFADACDEHADRAGGPPVASSQYGGSARGTLVRVQMEKATSDKPLDAKRLADEAALIEQCRPMLLEEIGSVPNWQRYVAPHLPGNTPQECLANLSNERLGQIFDMGMVGYAEFDGTGFPRRMDPLSATVGEARARTPLQELGEHMPITKLKLRSNSMMGHAWADAQQVATLPPQLTSLEIEHSVLTNLAAQNALFKHPLMGGLQSLKLAEPESGHRYHVYVDPGLASPPNFTLNTNQEAAAEAVDGAFVKRLTGGTLGNNLKKLVLDYGHVSNEGVRALINSPKLKNTVIDFTGQLYSQHHDIAQGTFAMQVDAANWRDLAVHNMQAARSQGGNYQMPEFMREAINAGRSTRQWLMRQYVEQPEDLLTRAERRALRGGGNNGGGTPPRP